MHASKFIHKTRSTSAGVDVKSAFIYVEPKVEHLRDLTVVKQLAAKLAVIHHAARAAVLAQGKLQDHS